MGAGRRTQQLSAFPFAPALPGRPHSALAYGIELGRVLGLSTRPLVRGPTPCPPCDTFECIERGLCPNPEAHGHIAGNLLAAGDRAQVMVECGPGAPVSGFIAPP